ncbi:MAG: SDR family oxidoreductase [Caldilineaceae bacterium]|nr:SDR family oxidoreductase [Caldilineaceae bacterium]
MKKKLQGQVAIVTGASRGIGAAVAEKLVAAGARVVLTARSEDDLEALATRLRKEGGMALAVAADITDPEQVEEVVETAVDQFERIDILVNNAGVVWPVEELAYSDADEWVFNIYTNLIAPYYLARLVLPLMLDQQFGRILNISSGVAVRPVKGFSAYGAAKAGLDMWTKTLALEIEGRGVTANVLYPGMVNTAMQEDVRSVDTTGSSLDFSNFHKAYAEGILQEPAAVADMICWLVGPWAKDHNGKVFTAGDAAWAEQVRRDLA